jgi:hypothetical protein
VRAFAILFAVISIAFLVLAILAYHESIRLLREAEKVPSFSERLKLWAVSALYMLMFIVFVLMFFVSIVALTMAIYKGEKDSRVWVRQKWLQRLQDWVSTACLIKIQ